MPKKSLENINEPYYFSLAVQCPIYNSDIKQRFIDSFVVLGEGSFGRVKKDLNSNNAIKRIMFIESSLDDLKREMHFVKELSKNKNFFQFKKCFFEKKNV